jgi:hypothetical protein
MASSKDRIAWPNPQFYHVPAKIIETKISKSEAGEMVVLLCGTEMNHISCYMTVIILELQ